MRKPASFYFFKRKPIVLKERYECWRGVAEVLDFATRERLGVEWMVFYYTVGKENAALSAQHFGISRKTFHKWLKRFRGSKYDVHSLADRARAHNLLQLLKAVALSQEYATARPKRLGFAVFTKFGRVINHAGEALLRIASSAWEGLIRTAYHRIFALGLAG
jgi:hypothetical protein